MLRDDNSYCDHWGEDYKCSRCGSDTTGQLLCPAGPVTWKMQGVDCPYCEKGESHSHFQALTIRGELKEGSND